MMSPFLSFRTNNADDVLHAKGAAPRQITRVGRQYNEEFQAQFVPASLTMADYHRV